MDALRLLKRRSSLVVADLPMPSEMKAGGHHLAMRPHPQSQWQSQTQPRPQPQPAPAVFEEPDANSLLDSFGF